MTKNNLAFPLRIWVVDNSGSMNKGDGNRLVETRRKEDVKVVSCTRWKEIQQTVDYHVQMAALLHAPTVFRLLNDPGRGAGEQQFSIAEKGEAAIPNDVTIARKTMGAATPGGVTPLSAHVYEIRSNIMAMESELRSTGSKAAIVLATDGLPTDEHGMCDQYTKNQFKEALKTLEGLPIWVVVRLCTDDDDVVEFYNELDHQLEFSLEVLDDFMGEAKEVYEHNDWLNYALPLHRCREMGYHNRLFDLLDERKLTVDEMRDMITLLLGDLDGAPDPQADWKEFLKVVESMLAKEKKQWNPMKRRLTPWIDTRKLDRAYRKKGFFGLF